MKSIFCITLGCAKNRVDTEIMLGHLTSNGYELIDDPAQAHSILINTCGFIESAKKEAIDTVLNLAEYKKNGQCQMLIVAGCLAQRYADDLSDSLPEVDLFLGVGDFHQIIDHIHANEKKAVSKVSEYLYDHVSPRVLTTSPYMAYVKVAEGCDNRCSYCAIPLIRGGFRSRSIASVIKEVENLIAGGVKEVNLISQDTTAFGKGSDESLVMLVKELLNYSKSDIWFRILYAYPYKFPMELIDLMRLDSRLCSYIDIPIQHVNNHLLKQMNRRGSYEETLHLIESIRARYGDITLRTSVIVGFPGETEEMFAELEAFIEHVKFDHLGVFTYSAEEDTPAYDFSNHVPSDIAQLRSDKLMQIQQCISREKNKSMRGRRVRALVEGVSSESDLLLQARHIGQAAEVDGIIYINEGTASVGDFVDIEITDTHDYDLVGKIV